ncbi:MAG: LTA synthase family protein [Gallionella sp.]|nr:LTA synthase family protein [Gallionella sp.]
MSFFSRKFARHSLGVLSASMLQAWVIVLCVAATLSVLRVLQIAWHWPSGLEAPWSDISIVLLQGARFDLKVSAAAAVLLLPLLLLLPGRLHGWIGGTIAVLFVFASLANLHYFGFYKTPIDPIVFGFFEDDTKAIVQTIWSDFPVVLTLGILLVLSMAAIKARKLLYDHLSLRLSRRNFSAWITLLGVLLGMLMLVLTIKGTLRAMALGKQNVSVTTSQFLNDMVPNGVTALKFAWDNRRDSQDFRDPLLGLKQLGFNSPLDAARELGIKAADLKELREALMVAGTGQGDDRKKNLLFFLMESWSAEPFLYQADDFDVLGRLAPEMKEACHFSNFDSVQPGTHPTLEALLFSSPITPLTLGPQGKMPIPWAIPRVLQRAGYQTLFVTSARAGWRDLDRVLKAQGFDEVIDANNLQAAYPDATLGIWGVWDSYVFKYISERLKKPQGDKPLFVFAFTSTNHPPYDLPSDYRHPKLNMDKWKGERNSETLEANLDSYRYATDLLGELVREVRSGPLRASTVIAASGDHNARSFGMYTTPERHYLEGQVPFLFWGDGAGCGTQQKLPASHRDMFPTLLPLAGVNGGYINTGRNLLANPASLTDTVLNAPRILRYYGSARNDKGIWKLGDPASFVCTPGGAKAAASCRFDAKDDAQERARLGLLDWNVRDALRKP